MVKSRHHTRTVRHDAKKLRSLAFLPSGSCTAELALVTLPSSPSVPSSGFEEVKNPCRKVTMFWSIRRRSGNKATDRRNSSSLELPGPSGLTASSSTCNGSLLVTHHTIEQPHYTCVMGMQKSNKNPNFTYDFLSFWCRQLHFATAL